MLLPKTNPYVPGDISIFNTLVSAGEEKSCIALPYHLRGFLVDCLVEHVRDREIVHTVLALSLLHSAEKLGEQGNVLLKQTGDGALLLAGLFPERALRLHVSSRYFRLIGQTAYTNLAAKFQVTGRPERGKFYNAVATHFHLLEKVLDAARVRTSEWELFRRFRVSLE